MPGRSRRRKSTALQVVPPREASEQPCEVSVEMNRTWGPFGIEVRLVFRPLTGDTFF